ncbi:TrkH family potassium uptake protein [Jiangella anatolica]|uniref:TrkH family potassium uptake protein n=1 Tax=Jiangella anatolica TaxID=2670374 RepID=UPI0018F76393|nr:potassium transporter TrkG [Jiangella anatolica]
MGWARRPGGRGYAIRRARRPQPAQVVVVAFVAVVLAGTLLLMLPIAREGPGSAPPLVALFTSTSATCVTGLIVVDTPAYWSTFGEVVILGLIQVGGFGIMTLGSLLVLLVARRLGLRTRLTAATESKGLDRADVRRVVLGVAAVTATFELTVGAILTARLATQHGESLDEAAYHGFFHAIAAFNNVGFSLYSTNLMGFVGDPLIFLPIAVSVICAGLGFPVLLELRHRWRSPRRWTLHTQLTVVTSALLLVAGTVYTAATEWRNVATFGSLDGTDRVLAAFFHSSVARTAGFNTVDVTQMTDATWLGTDVLMFIGGGSAGTAGGIKVTTFALLFFAIFSEIRGDPTVHVLGRRIGDQAQRQALTVALLAIAVVMVPTVLLVATTRFGLDEILLEVTSAFSTAGLSAGITGQLPAGGQLLLVFVMFIGRVGTITLASALVLRQRTRLYERPEERPIIG